MPIYEYECLSCGRPVRVHRRGFRRGDGQDVQALWWCFAKRVLSKGVTSRMDGIIGDRGGKTCCGREERCGSPPCSEPGSCCR